MSDLPVLSVLLQYPTEEVLAGLDELRAAVPDAGGPLSAFLDDLAGIPLDALQDEYVRTFDFDPGASLHLTYHLYGDQRKRGTELARLKLRFAEAGLRFEGEELPDFLPVLLELADLAPEQGVPLLASFREPIELVRGRLRAAGSRYAVLLDAVVAGLPRLTAEQVERIRALDLEPPPSELVGLEPAGAAP